ncbi:CPBP family intramembrane metalloprotease [Hoyosella sp. YIM 151337]|uniref:CPBP family intramembrane glutamic endopeptidase n=1 Tax=Hoyosella sp. YIM 151337 TaxID=2992742 RepID=UPI002236179D|nr:type II CAAX endopeptidase family protein [Hoyosella sp. YIM 151337]MCW4353951.1 CPBP family intramembrane metalloprotease [Hoyosella sp. YIM 151337]
MTPASPGGGSSRDDADPPPDWWYPTGIGGSPREGAQTPHISPYGAEPAFGNEPPERRDLSASRSRSVWWRSEEAAVRRQPGQRWGMGAFALVLAINFFGFAAAAVLVEDTASPLLVPAIILPTLLAATAAFAISWLRGNGPVIDFGLPATMRELLRQAGVGLACGSAAVIGGIILALILFQMIDEIPDSVLEEAAGLSLNARIALAMWVWIGAPFAEEIIFRGMLWGALERYRFFRQRGRVVRYLSTNWAILGITTVVFALVHAEFWRLPILLFAGSMFGLARLYTGSAFSATVAHVVNNTLPALGVLLMPELIT